MIIELSCTFCNTAFSRSYSEYARNQRNEQDAFFCSTRCFGKYKTKEKRRFVCLVCNKSCIQSRKNKALQQFCSVNCANHAGIRPSKRTTPLTCCSKCSCPLTYKNTRGVCRQCHWKSSYEQYISGWLSGSLSGNQGENVHLYVRRYLFCKNASGCEECGWSEINPSSNLIPLQVDHIDGNYLNSSPSNLRLLCPNHHALTPTFGSLNLGKGRKARIEKIRTARTVSMLQ